MGIERQPPIPSTADLANRLNLALDRFEVLHGEPLTFPEIQSFLQDLGVPLSRSRWAYMIRGEGWKVSDRNLLAGLADLLDVPVDFFYTGALPPEMEAEIGLVRTMRVAKVQNYAARVLGDVSPEALKAITEALASPASSVEATAEDGDGL